jgi:catechol 2,3-dioxygenase-like lactoylglutathione lyase family enzyme
MTRLISALWLLVSMATGTAWAQPFPTNQAGVTMGHLHLNSRDVEANRKIFVAMGGTATKAGDFDIVRFPGVNVYLHLRPGAPPPAGDNDGTVVQQVGFAVQDIQAAIGRLNTAGVPVAVGGNPNQASLMTADGLRIAIVEDKAQALPIQHHHVQFFVAEAAIPEIQAWYAKLFGARSAMQGENSIAEIPGVNMRFAKTETPTATTKGQVLDHIGFDVKNLEAFLQKLEAAGIKLDRPYTKNPLTNSALAFIYDPWGTYIELNERPGTP